jgi:hypothetical protein
VTGAPDLSEDSIKVSDNKVSDNIELRFISDNDARDIMRYSVDYGDKEDITIDLKPEIAINVRVQGDIVLTLEPLNTNRLLSYIGIDGILEHIRFLLIDIINRILLDYGMSPTVRRNGVILESVAPRRNDDDNVYRRKVFKLLVKELKEFLGDIDVNEDFHEIRIKNSDFNGFIIRIRIRGGGRRNPYNHIVIEIDHNLWDLQNSSSFITLQNELLKEFENMQPMDIEFSLGNHHIRISKAKPLSLMYRPSRQPLTLNENLITLMNPLRFIVTPSTTIELTHREHGLKVVRFKNNYIVTFTDVATHEDYLSERNRVILRNLEL